MRTAEHILDDQVLHVKRRRLNQSGFEPAWKAYFDLYLSPKYIEPLLVSAFTSLKSFFQDFGQRHKTAKHVPRRHRS
jgi:hypothetical protein